MYCYYNVLPEAIFVVYLLKTLLTFFLFRATYLQQNFQFGGVTVLAVQLFNKIKEKNNFKKIFFLYFPHVMSNYI